MGRLALFGQDKLLNTNSEDFQLRYSWKSLFIMLVLFSVLFAYIVFLGIDDIISSILDADIIFLLLALFVYYLSLIVRSFRWRLFLDSLTNQYKRVSYWDIYTLITFSFALNNVFPLRTGELYRPYELSKKFNYSLLSSFATVVLERTFDVIIMGSLIITSAMFQGMDTLLSTTEIAGNLIFSLVIVLGFVLLLFFLSREETTYIIVLILNYLSGLIQKKIIPEEEETAQKVSIEVSHLLKNKKVVIIGILSSLIIWLMEGAVFLFIAFAMNIHLSFIMALFILLLSGLIGNSITSASGLGQLPFMIAQLLLFIPNISQNEALSTSIVYLFIVFWVIVPIGTILHEITRIGKN